MHTRTNFFKFNGLDDRIGMKTECWVDAKVEKWAENSMKKYVDWNASRSSYIWNHYFFTTVAIR